MAIVLPYLEVWPRFGRDVFLAPNATVTGPVTSPTGEARDKMPVHDPSMYPFELPTPSPDGAVSGLPQAMVTRTRPSALKANRRVMVRTFLSTDG